MSHRCSEWTSVNGSWNHQVCVDPGFGEFLGHAGLWLGPLAIIGVGIVWCYLWNKRRQAEGGAE